VTFQASRANNEARLPEAEHPRLDDPREKEGNTTESGSPSHFGPRCLCWTNEQARVQYRRDPQERNGGCAVPTVAGRPRAVWEQSGPCFRNEGKEKEGNELAAARRSTGQTDEMRICMG
jgi:hypothetical protein